MQYVTWIGFGIFWMFLSVDPVSRFDWVLENVLLVCFLAAYLTSYRTVNWTTLSFVAVFGFSCSARDRCTFHLLVGAVR